MFYPVTLLEQLEELGSAPLETNVFRHMLGSNVPAHMNIRGARWNPPQVAAIYTSIERETAIAEADYYLSLQDPPIRVRRTVYSIHVSLQRVADLRDAGALNRVGIDSESLRSLDMSLCQRIGGAVARLGCDGLLIPSVRRADGMNLVIYPGQQELEDSEFKVIGEEVIDPGR